MDYFSGDGLTLFLEITMVEMNTPLAGTAQF